ncbi:hypothetical protein OUZ56_012790 [Daphnia magna]|uniref:Uncharacterized protein n=1 Tax=Daphnia magna TaxID=35525 RepID=A0ABQ9Z428_9CRUS|nr:hypothetical protein OUZ56_012790 [Daphnia magna]
MWREFVRKQDEERVKKVNSENKIKISKVQQQENLIVEKTLESRAALRSRSYPNLKSKNPNQSVCFITQTIVSGKFDLTFHTTTAAKA